MPRLHQLGKLVTGEASSPDCPLDCFPDPLLHINNVAVHIPACPQPGSPCPGMPPIPQLNICS